VSAHELYNHEILGLARCAHGKGRLDSPVHSIVLNNPLCGDRITLDVAVEHGTIAALGHVVRGCMLCDAAASWLGLHVPGCGIDEAAELETTVRGLLSSTADAVADGARNLMVFSPVAPFRARHRCVTLPFEALVALISDLSAG